MATPPPSTTANGRAGFVRTSTAPAKSSPLREISPTEEMKQMSLKDGPATPLESDSKPIPTGPRALRAGGVLDTPPDSSIRDLRPAGAQATGSMGSFSYKSSEDPFVTPTGKEVVQVVPNSVSRALVEVPQAAASPRQDRLGQEINAETAQGIFEPKACVFVANLSNQKSDEELEHSVHNVYDAFGRCYVKIRRDKNKMPFAFVQFETVEAANQAIDNARGTVIDGRVTRCEHAKVNRTLFLTRNTGGTISEAEARALLEEYGPISLVTQVSPLDKHFLDLPEGILVEFAYFQDARDAQMAMKHHEKYRVAVPQSAPEVRGSTGSYRAPSSLNFRSSYGFQTYRRNGDDGCAVFVGNLAPDTTTEQLAQAFAEFGQSRPSIVKKLGPNGGINTFAFLNFDTKEQANAALGAELVLHGNQLRIEPKQSGYNRAPRYGYGSRDAQEQVVPNMYPRGMDLGVSPEHAARFIEMNSRAHLANGAQGFGPHSPMTTGIYYPPFANQGVSPIRQHSGYAQNPAHAMQGYPYQVNPIHYNMSGMQYAPAFGNMAELDDHRAIAMHTIHEAEEANIANRQAH